MMSSEKEKKEKETISMTEFWKVFGARLAQFVPDTKINEFEIQKGLTGFRLDRVVQGKKGVDVKTLLRICTTLDLSPTWLLYGKGRQRLSEVRNPSTADRDKILERLLHWVEALPKSQQREITTLLEELQHHDGMPEEASRNLKPLDTGKPSNRAKKN